jgi:hypothetical protein
MKSNLKYIGLLATALITMASCSKNEDEQTPAGTTPPSPSAFKGIQEKGLSNRTQSFTVTAGGEVTLTSEKGVVIKIKTDNLTKNGNAVTGTFDLKFVELFDKGSMLATNKSTMGKILGTQDQTIMRSGGEFYINATQDGVQLATNGVMDTFKLKVSETLSGDPLDNLMTFWSGNTTDPENIVWERKDGGQVGFNSAVGTNGYNVTFGNFGWSNIDRLYSLPGVKTQILATVPTGYNETNCAIYFSLDGEGTNQLAKFDIYNPTTMQFSEHYGQIPIGQACHLIFVTAEGTQWRYAVKAVTVAAGVATNFTLAETVVGSEAQMVAAINAIQ